MDSLIIPLFIVSMIGFLIFVRWDRHRIEKSAGLPKHGVAVPAATEQGRGFARICVGLAIVTAALAFSDWSSPSHPPFSGRWSSVSSMLYSVFGPLGSVWLKLFVSVCLVLLARWAWRRTPKKPHDKLFF